MAWRWLTGRSGWDDVLLFGALGVGMVLCVAVIVHDSARERAEHDAKFLRQCAEAGYDAAKCRFFLTASGGGKNSDVAMQLILQSAAH
jgi:hypothetical protein